MRGNVRDRPRVKKKKCKKHNVCEGERERVPRVKEVCTVSFRDLDLR
jgi:hypothetical protein